MSSSLQHVLEDTHYDFDINRIYNNSRSDETYYLKVGGTTS
jgi:hypothetical protein